MGLSINTAITFNAIWNNQNQHLSKGFFEKINQIFFHFLHSIARSLILPASNKSAESIEYINRDFSRRWQTSSLQQPLLNKNFLPMPIEVTTPDGITLRGTYFKHISAEESSPTVIFFQPNGTISKQGTFDAILEQAALLELSYNFVYFDYRGCGESEGRASSQNDLFLDGDSIYQFVKDKLNVPANSIHFYSRSLGGISAHIKARHPECEGNLVIDRSFSSVNDVIINIIDLIITHVLKVSSNIIGTLIAKITGIFCSCLNWNITNTEAVISAKGKTLIVHHPSDELMKNQASLYHSILQKNPIIPSHIKELNLGTSSNHQYSFHNAPISEFKTETFDPMFEISRFLFSLDFSFNQKMIQIFHNSTSAFKNEVFTRVAREFQNGELRLGEDAVNRRNGQFISEDSLANIIGAVKFEGY